MNTIYLAFYSYLEYLVISILLPDVFERFDV